MSKYTYSKSGVDIDKGNKFIENIKKTIKNDKTKSSKASVIGGFAGLWVSIMPSATKSLPRLECARIIFEIRS